MDQKMSGPAPSSPRKSGWFGGMGKAQSNGQGGWFNRGEYVCVVETITRRESQKKKGHRLVIGKLRVLHVITEYPSSQKPGEVGTVYVNLDSDYPSMDEARLRGLVEAIAGDTAGFGDDEWEAITDTITEPPGTFAAGQILRVSAQPVETQAKNVIIALSFAAARPEDAAYLPTTAP